MRLPTWAFRSVQLAVLTEANISTLRPAQAGRRHALPETLSCQNSISQMSVCQRLNRLPGRQRYWECMSKQSWLHLFVGEHSLGACGWVCSRI